MIAQGEDISVEVILKDKNNVSIPYGSLDSYTFSLYKLCEGQKVNLFTYKKGATGIAAIDIDALDNTKATIVINTMLTANTNPKDLFLEVKIKVAQAGNYIGGLASKIETDIPLDELIQSSNPKA